MRILYFSTVFPRPTESSTIYTDLAEELFAAGHSIQVVAADEGRKTPETTMVYERGMPVLRVTIGNMYDVGILRKGLTVATMEYNVIRAMRKHLAGESYDVILFESPPVTTHHVVKWAMYRFKCPSYLMLKDIFPQNAVDLGLMTRFGLPWWYFRLQERKLYRTATMIGCMSEGNKQYVLKHNPDISPNKLKIFPNTKKVTPRGEVQTLPNVRLEYGIPSEAMVVLYGGNLGKPQGVDYLFDVIQACQGRTDVFFVVVGRGTERNSLRERIQSQRLSNVLLLDSLPREQYDKLLAGCDVGVVCLDKRFTIPNYPSRILSYFDFSLPVIAATDRCTDFPGLVRDSGAGFWVEAGNVSGFLHCIDALSRDPLLRRKMGRAGREYMERNLSVAKSVQLLEQHLMENIVVAQAATWRK